LALQGKFPHDVELSTLLQSIYLDKKTGVLYLTKNKEEAALGFENGFVVASYIIRKGEFESLPTYLVLSGKVSENVMKKMTDESKKSSIPVEELLVEEGILTRRELEEIIVFKIQEVMDEILTWREGWFNFVPEDRIYKFSKVKAKVDPQYLLMEGVRRQGEWPKMKSKISSDEVIPYQKEVPEIDVELSPREIRVLELVNGKRKVKEIAKLSGIGRFKTYEALYHLIETGWIEIKEEEKIEIKKKEEVVFPSLRFYEKKSFIGIIGSILLCFALFFSVYFKIFLKNFKQMNFMPYIFEEERKVAEFLWKK